MIRLSEIVGQGYNEFWNTKKRYRIVKGSRGSKKSCTTALWYIFNMMNIPGTNVLVLRRYYYTHKDSTYTQLKWAIDRLQVAHLWDCKLSPLTITYKPTGQKILFRGLDDPQSITSITVDTGYLCWAWFEEFYQVNNEDDFDKIDMSIRGKTPPHIFKQITGTFNPWNEGHWLKTRFFDNPDENTYSTTTNYKVNEFLGDDDIKLFEDMKKNRPRRYQVEGLGEWGVSEGLIFENWEVREFDVNEIRKIPGIKSCFGLDFGYTCDPTALQACLADMENMKLYIFDEHYERGMTNKDIAEMIKYKGYSKERIIADSAEPKSIEEIKRQGIYRIQAAAKGKDSILNGIQFQQQFDIVIHPKCTNTILEFNNYAWAKDKEGRTLNKPIDEFNHCFSGDTLITTKEGHKRIDTINVCDLVLTRKGYKKVKRVFYNGVKKVNSYRFANGKSLTSTDTHNIITVDGKKYIRELSRTDKLYFEVGKCKYIKTENQKYAYIKAKSIEDIQTAIDVMIEFITKEAHQVVIIDCMLRYTRKILEKFQNGMSFIIKTKTHLTTILKIWSVFLYKNTVRNIQKRFMKKTWRGQNVTLTKLDRLQKCGTHQKMDGNGIVNMGKIYLRTSHIKNIHVCIVKLNLKPSQMVYQSFVVTSASLLIGARLALMMLVDLALFVAKFFQQTDIQSQKHVQLLVDQNLHIETEVYNLEIEDQHEYFANGVLVSNCHDSRRYACESLKSGSWQDWLDYHSM